MKKYIIFLLILIGFICISTVSAADNATDDIVSSTQDVELKKVNVEKVESKVHFDNNKIIKKSNVKIVNIKLKKNGITGKKLKTGDKLLAITNSGFGQYGRSINIGTLINVGQEGQHSTKLLKAKVYFKNKYTGKIIVKKAKAIKHNYNIKPLKWIDKLSPLKAKIWYKPR